MVAEAATGRARQAVLASLAEVVPGADLGGIDPAAELRIELDLDSLDVIAVMTGIAQRAGVVVPERDYPLVLTLDACIAYVAERLAA